VSQHPRIKQLGLKVSNHGIAALEIDLFVVDADVLEAKLEKFFDRREVELVEVIEEWLRTWMNVTGTTPEDAANYHRRAFGVDANMRYSLARLLIKHFAASEIQQARLFELHCEVKDILRDTWQSLSQSNAEIDRRFKCIEEGKEWRPWAGKNENNL